MSTRRWRRFIFLRNDTTQLTHGALIQNTIVIFVAMRNFQVLYKNLNQEIKRITLYLPLLSNVDLKDINETSSSFAEIMNNIFNHLFFYESDLFSGSPSFPSTLILPFSGLGYKGPVPQTET